jgi:hypothetical protein
MLGVGLGAEPVPTVPHADSAITTAAAAKHGYLINRRNAGGSAGVTPGAITSAPYVWKVSLARPAAVAAALILLTACNRGSTSSTVVSPARVQASLTAGLIAYVADQGIGVLDPSTGKSMLVSPLPAGGAFRVAGPVWATAPGLAYPVIYIAIHDDRPAESRSGPGVVPYDWIFRIDPFKGTIEPLSASSNFQIGHESEGPIGLVATSQYLAFTLGPGADLEVDALDLTQPTGGLKAVAKPPTQAPLFTEGATPGPNGLIAVRVFGTGAWYFLNPALGVLNPFPLKLGSNDGPVVFSPDGTKAAVSPPDQGPIIYPVNLTPPSPVASVTAGSPAPGASPAPATSPAATSVPPSSSPATPPHHVNSKLTHADDLAWSPDQKQLAVAVNGELDLYSVAAADGTAPSAKYLSGANVIGIDWSGPIAGKSFAELKANAGPQSIVDALLQATQLPTAADSPAARALTKVYLWQYDSSKTSPIATIADATPAILQQNPPLAASVDFHHWSASGTWALVGGCARYRVVITGSIAPVASTFGLASNTPCNQAATPSPKTTASPKATASP